MQIWLLVQLLCFFDDEEVRTVGFVWIFRLKRDNFVPVFAYGAWNI